MASRKIYLSRNIEDVEAYYPDDADILTWVAASGMWMPVVGGGGGGHTIQDDGVDQTQRTNLNFIGNGVTVLDDPGNDATKITIDLVSGMLSQEVYETLTAQVVSGISHFNLSNEIDDDSLRVYYNGIRQQGDYFVVDSDNLGFTTAFVVDGDDEIFVDYEITTSGIGLLTAYFTSLLDTPGTFTGDGEKFVKVNVGENALEFVTVVLPDEFTDLTDTPANYTAASGLYLKVTDVEDGLEFSAVSAGGASVLSDTVANEPAAGTEEDLFLPTDGIHIKRDDGAAWLPWGPLFPMLEPVLGDFAWINQGTAVVDDTYGGLFMTALAAAGDSHKILKQTAPSTPWTLTVALIPQLYKYNYNQCGIGYRQSGDGKLVTFTIAGNAPELVINKWNSPTSYNSGYQSTNWNPLGSPIIWLRLEDDGVDRIMSWSLNGAYWTQQHSVGRTDFLTADEIFIYVDSNNSTYPVSCLFLSWALT